jgi:two-component system chemotaxis response regulator CheB
MMLDNPSFCSATNRDRHGGRVVVIGASAGGVAALHTLLSTLPPHFPFPILVVLHLSATRESELVAVLASRSQLPVKWGEDGEIMRPGMVYVSRPDRHLIVRSITHIGVTRDEKVSWWRPAVDALFLSAAEVFQERTIAVVLSGMMWDGAAGIAAVVRAGGITIAQDEKSAGFFDMPAAALISAMPTSF